MTKKTLVKNKLATKEKSVKKTPKLSDKAILAAFGEISTAIRNLSLRISELSGEDVASNTTDGVTDGVAVKTQGKLNSKKSISSEKSTAKTVSEIKARYELWSYDEYNQGSIVHSNSRFDKVLEAAKRYVTEQNVDNALAASEKDKSWEAYFPQVFVNGEVSHDVVYAGNKRDGKHYVYVKGVDKWELRCPDATVQFKFFLGNTSSGRNKSEWFLTNQKGKEINSITDQALERKTVLFVKVI